MIKTFIVECDNCHKQIDAVKETYHPSEIDGDLCNACFEEGS